MVKFTNLKEFVIGNLRFVESIGVELVEELINLDNSWNIIRFKERQNAQYDIPIDKTPRSKYKK